MLRGRPLVVLSLLGGLCGILPAAVHSQQPVRVREVSPTEQTSAESFGPNASVRALSDGRLVLHDGDRRRIVLLNDQLRIVTVVVDSATMSGAGLGDALPSYRLLPFKADTTGFMDIASQKLLFIDPAGRVARSVAPPNAGDQFLLAGRSWMGIPSMDRIGRIVYRGNAIRRSSPSTPSGWEDSVPLVRWDLALARVDTIGQLRYDVAARRVQTGSPVGTTPRTLLNPLPFADAWTILSDGTIAILRSEDHRIDWISAGDTRRATTSVANPYPPLTLAQKQQHIDTLRTGNAARIARGSGGASIPDLEYAAASEIPDRFPAFHPRDVLADADGFIWVARPGDRTGRVYDLINRDGRVVERVRIPAGQVVVGLGPGRSVYLMDDGAKGPLRRSRVR